MRKQFKGRSRWFVSAKAQGLVGRFGEMAVCGSRVLVRAKSQCFDGILWRQGNTQQSCVGQEPTYGSRVLVRSKPQGFGGALRRDGS